MELMPYYMHLNVEEIEVCFLISCVLLDTHLTIAKKNNFATPEISSKFKNFLKKYEEEMFVNSRNNNKDCVFVCYRKIIQGDS